MNVTFHTLAGLAIAAALCPKQESAAQPQKPFAAATALRLIAGCIAGVLSHGVLDLIPHTYPIKSTIDPFLSLILFSVAILLAKKQCWMLIFACFLGSILPDIVDHAPAILNHRLGWSLPVIGFFPWHWPVYSGSVYGSARTSVSIAMHLTLIALCLRLILRRKN
jgi:hypothetical protein